jgi:hypothetical protein
MDTTFCPAGMATDRVMLYGSDVIAFSCDVPIANYVVPFALMSVIRCMVTAFQIKLWLRKGRQAKSSSRRQKTRIPALPALSMLTSFFLILFTILTSLNIANTLNGGSLLIMALFFLPFSLGFPMFIHRVIKLGQKIIPLANVKFDEDDAKRKILADLSQYRIPMRITVFLLTIAILMTPIAALAGLGVHSFVVFQVAASGYIAQDVLIGVGFTYQYERVISAVKICGLTSLQSPERRSQIQKAINRLRLHQAVFIYGPITAIFWALNVSRVILPHYW